MPKAAQHFAIARQWQILQLVPVRPPGITARAVQELLAQSGITVSKRTVERDLNELSLVFDLTCMETGQAQGWYFATHRVPNIGAIDHLDAMLLVLAGDVMDAMLPKEAYAIIQSRIDKAREKLKSIQTLPVSKWVDKVRYVHPTLPQIRPQVKKEILRSLQQCLVQERQCSVLYQNFSGEEKMYRLNPLALILRGNIAYLVASAFSYTDVRLYAVHRFRNVLGEDAASVAPEGFNLDTYLATGALGFEAGDEFVLRATVSSDLATLLREAPLSHDQSLTSTAGQYQLLATVRDSWQLKAWILSQGANIRISAPDTLREHIAATLRRATAGYDVRIS